MTTYAFQSFYQTPSQLDNLVLFSDGTRLTGVYFEGTHSNLSVVAKTQHNLPIFQTTHQWLDSYFAGHPLASLPPYRLPGETPFRRQVSQLLLQITWGETTTYGQLARQIAQESSVQPSRLLSRAVGAAVSWNPLCILIPCHRVLGAHNRLTGYSGGIRNKIALLAHEGIQSKKEECI